jgi:hypothetical protein
MNEGLEAIAFGHSFSATIRFIADPGLPGNGQSEDARTAGAEHQLPAGNAINMTTIRHKKDP